MGIKTINHTVAVRKGWGDFGSRNNGVVFANCVTAIKRTFGVELEEKELSTMMTATDLFNKVGGKVRSKPVILTGVEYTVETDGKKKTVKGDVTTEDLRYFASVLNYGVDGQKDGYFMDVVRLTQSEAVQIYFRKFDGLTCEVKEFEPYHKPVTTKKATTAKKPTAEKAEKPTAEKVADISVTDKKGNEKSLADLTAEVYKMVTSHGYNFDEFIKCLEREHKRAVSLKKVEQKPVEK